jgi:hypothetical protein
MFANKFFKNSLFSIAIFSFIFTAFALDAAAQCGGVYFKRTTGAIASTPNTTFHHAEDMTGDGVPDLLGTGAQTLSDGYRKIVILPANGTGGFGSQIVITTPARIASYIPGDFDTDAFKDIVVLLETAPQTILVYKNNGNGTFTPQTQGITTQSFPHLFLDINGDGKGDYIGFFPNTSAYKYSLGNGDGTFGTPVDFYQGSGHFVAGDFSGDGKVDFIAGTSMLINNGNGIFNVAPAGFSLSQYENIQYIKDFNGDGKLDIATKTSTGSTYKVSVLLNNGNNTFSRTDYTVIENAYDGTWSGDLLVGNFSGNSALDLLYRPTAFANKTVVFTNNGSGVFTRQDYNYSGKGFFTGDFDGDGKTDIVNTTVSSVFGEAVAVVYKNVCDQPGQTEIVDFNRDGQTDKTYWDPSTGNWTYKTSQYGTPTTVNWGLGSLGDIPMPGDYDKDGITDLAVYRNSTGVWYIRQSSNLAWYTIQWGVSGDKPVSQDYDGDGYTDVAVWRPSDGNWYIWHMGTQTYTIFHWGANGDRPAPEDYDGDGKTDYAVFRPNTGEWFILRSIDGAWTYTQFGIGDDEIVPADYDGDGKAEIAMFRPSVGLWFIKRTPEASSYTSFFFGQNIDRPQPGDYNGDGAFDAAVYRPSAATWYTTLSNEQDNFGVGGAIAASSILRVPQ